MSKKTTFLAVSACFLSLGALGVGAFAYYEAWMNQPLDAAPEVELAPIGDVAGVAASAGDVALELTPLDEGGNTQVLWRCGKDLMGQRHDYTGAWTRFDGRALIDAAAGVLEAGELRIAVAAMRGHGRNPAPNAMINTVRDNQWFAPEHPTAVLTTRGVRVRKDGEVAGFSGAVEGWTHALPCKLALNGIERDLTVYARVAIGEQRLELDAAFPVSRKEFQVEKRTGYEPPAEVDDEVLVEVRVRATPDPLAVVAELNKELVAQQAATGRLEAQLTTTTARLDKAEQGLDELRRELEKLASRAAAPAAAASVDVSALPARFTDRVDYENSQGDDRLADLGYTAEFEMVLVPGDPAKGIDPFYVQTTEVTWEMFRAWSYCADIADESHAVKLKEELLRPSPCYDDASRGHGFEGRAVLGISRRNALAFCRFVSAQTGRSYRIWTDEEWRYIAEATGGVPEDPYEVAWLAGNSDKDEWGDTLSMPVAKKPANRFGLYDFWGNVAEWVMADEQYIRGGSYLVTKEELSIDWRENESQDVWNLTYPNIPKSLWWYRDRYDMGFRLVCDPVNLPESK